MVPSISRRRALRASCVAGIAALAGCLGGDDDDGDAGDAGDDDSPNDGDDSPDDGTGGDDTGNGDGENGTADVRPYQEYVAADEAGEVTAIYVDLVATGAAEEGFQEDLITESEDPLLLLPAVGVQTLLSLSQTFEGIGLGPLLDREGTEFESELEALMFASQGLIAAGTIETDEIDETLREDAQDGTGVFEQVEDIGEYTLYQPVTGESGDTVAVSSTDIISAGARAPVERAIEAVEGDRPRATEEIEPFAWVLDAVDDHHVAFAGHGESPGDPDEETAFDALTDATSFVATHRFENTELTAETAAVFESGGALDDATGEIEASFGSEAADVSFDFENDRVSISGTYERE